MQPTALNPDLEAVILAKRDDPAAWGVYADFFEGHGDPRAELMAVMLAREGDPTPELAKKELELLTAHRDVLLPSLSRGDLPFFSLESPPTEMAWRRGFLHELEVTDLERLDEVLAHPSARLLDTVLLSRALLTASTTAWSDVLARVAGTRLPWRRLTVDGPDRDADLAPLLAAMPRLESLRVSLREPWTVDLRHAASPSLKELIIDLSGADALPRLGELPALRRLELREPRDPAGLLADAVQQPWYPALELIHLHNVVDLRAIVPLARPGGPRIVLGRVRREGLDAAPSVPGLVSYLEPQHEDGEDALESAFLLLEGRPSDDLRRTLANAARSVGASQFLAHFAPVDVAGQRFTACRFHGDDAVLLRPLALADTLLKHPALGIRRMACVVVSSSNNLARAFTWVTRGPGPARARQAPGEQSFHFRDEVLRRTLSDLLGVDPGPRAFDDVCVALDESAPVVLVGRANLVEAPLLTDVEAVPVPPDEEAEEEEWAEEDDEWQVPEPAPEPPSMVLLLQEVAAESAPVADEETEQEEPLTDAVNADLVEVLLEGPVDVSEEEWGELLAEDHAGDPDYLPPEEFAPLIEGTCVHCFATAVAACALCSAAVCEPCSRGTGDEPVICCECDRDAPIAGVHLS